MQTPVSIKILTLCKFITFFLNICFKRKNFYICHALKSIMQINEKGQKTDEYGNIYCVKTNPKDGHKKFNYMIPQFVNNAELMKAKGWEVVLYDVPQAAEVLTNTGGQQEEIKINDTQINSEVQPDIVLDEPLIINPEPENVSLQENPEENNEPEIIPDVNVSSEIKANEVEPLQDENSLTNYPAKRKGGRPKGSKNKSAEKTVKSKSKK